jgi:transketolase
MSNTTDFARLEKLTAMMRHYILTATTNAGSGHPTSSLSAVELMTALMFGGIFRYDPDRPKFPNNDRLIFSKGHATPLFYSLWVAAGKLKGDYFEANYRKFGSPLEGHPTVVFPYVEAATGSLGQGLSVGVGIALNARYLDMLPYRTYVLLGDSEMAEGSVWEALELGAHYKLDNLVAIADINRLGQRGETMYGHDLSAYVKRVSAFGWETIPVEDGHSLKEVHAAFEKALTVKERPVMIIARTIKGKGVSFIEDKNGWHGKTLNQQECDRALGELGEVDLNVRGELAKPEDKTPEEPRSAPVAPLNYPTDKKVATRKAYGNAMARLGPGNEKIVSIDGEVSNSTMAELFAKACPDRFFEMYIAEQNMAGVGLGLATRGKIPFVSTFAAFLSRAFDQVRMAQYSEPNLKFVGSHAGVSIGYDGPSQMGLEDLAMFRALGDSVVLYPSDAVSTERLVEEMVKHQGLMYMRTSRASTPIIYSPEDEFPLGGCKVLRHSPQDKATVVSAGVTLFEALEAFKTLKKMGIAIRVIDCYCLKPIAAATLADAARATGNIITVEDHYPAGGLGEAVMSALATAPVPVHCLAVTKKPKSGSPEELLDFEGISRGAIVNKVKEVLNL